MLRIGREMRVEMPVDANELSSLQDTLADRRVSAGGP